MKSVSELFHPAVWFFFFLAMLLCSMLFLHPVFIAAGLICAASSGFFFCGGKPVLRTVAFGLPAVLLIALFNPLVNHGGRTVLLYVANQTFTLEALIYGICSGCMLLLVFLWFCSYNRLMTPEKFLFLFSKAAPAASMLVTMTQRMIPLFTARASAIAAAQKTMLCDVRHGSLRERFQSGMRIITVLVSWSMEEGLDTADSMKARGYGAAKRTFYSRFRFRHTDIAAMVFLFACLIVCLWGYYTRISFQFYPQIDLPRLDLKGIIPLAAYCCLALLPLAAGLMEELRWHLSK